MRFIVSLVITFFLIGLPSLAIGEKYTNFSGKLIEIDDSTQQVDDESLKTLIKANPSSKNFSHYAFQSNNQWFLLDKNGNALAKKLLSSSKAKTGSYFMIKGQLQGNVIIVKQINDISVQEF